MDPLPLLGFCFVATLFVCAMRFVVRGGVDCAGEPNYGRGLLRDPEPGDRH